MEDQEVLYKKLKEYSDLHPDFKDVFTITEDSIMFPTAKERTNFLLNWIAHSMLYLTENIKELVKHFSKELPILLCSRMEATKPNCSKDIHIANTITLGHVIHARPDLCEYGVKYFEKFPSPFERKKSGSAVKRKFDDLTEGPSVDIIFIESCYYLLKSRPSFYRKKWNWSDFIFKFGGYKQPEAVWLTNQIYAILLGINENQLFKINNYKIKEKHFLEEMYGNYYFEGTLAPNTERFKVRETPKTSLEQYVVNISGIYLPIKSKNYNPNETKDFILVNSTVRNLRKISLGITSNKAVYLQGPVGSGKTSLIEYLAIRTGRKLGRDFVKVQLGDQTDSKMLLGTFRCTDVPGEFIWQPGVLTQAVVEGKWLLLEDIDSASTDIASVLASLLENRCLTVPGYRDSVEIKSGFQLFVTQRFISSTTGYHKKHTSSTMLLEKHMLQINVDPLTFQELKQIVVERHPIFETVADRFITIFQPFCDTSSISKSGRLISTRDFFKWCLRSARNYNVQNPEKALDIFQEALDIFCGSFADMKDSINLAKEICTPLGILDYKAEYYINNYRPTAPLTPTKLVVGRASLKRRDNAYNKKEQFFFSRPALVLLEKIACCVNMKEPVLLVGETGTGKTSSVQYLAGTLGRKLVVINMNQQSDSADLLGGFRPVDMKFIIEPVHAEFEEIFPEYFERIPNENYLRKIANCYNQQNWKRVVYMMSVSVDAAVERLSNLTPNDAEHGQKVEHYLKRFKDLKGKLDKLQLQLKEKSALAFSFIEGSLVTAVQKGYWVLLDEINLANAETIECLSGLLEGSTGSLCLLERGDIQPVKRHPDFALFACMNPSTDVGKKDLPAGLRNRFTEFFVHEMTEKPDLLVLVNGYIMSPPSEDMLERIVDFYLKVRARAEVSLVDGVGQKPHFSLRSLCRALKITAKCPCGPFNRSLYEAFCMSFLTQLDTKSYDSVHKMIITDLLGSANVKSILNQPIRAPSDSKIKYHQFEGFWISQGSLEPSPPEEYVLTKSVRRNLKDLARVVSIGKLPVLLQGDTSVGKTSLITYLAKSSGNKCVRINNHEHTDLQEYIGSYMADTSGKLKFKEGVLVEAMRKGYWIILDELNLAPTDVLEALNRVLDDNRELFIPETHDTVKADPNFMLFATQNPPGSYGGRKILSRAFRNRFVELHCGEIPPVELTDILHERCQMASSTAKKMVGVMMDLQKRRKGSAAFAGKQGFMTLRDLFRWGERYRLAQNSRKMYDWDQHLADEGYLILGGRMRKPEEKSEIITALNKHFKRTVVPYNLFTLTDKASPVTKDILEKINKQHPHIVWTYNMRQLAVLVSKALQFKEPVLLVGETGGGKTTVCELIAENNGQNLKTVNCHMHTESSDFIGGLRPVRDHSDANSGKFFEWVNGPLIDAMVNGDVFLADEISLADDSVLERLNSLLEPERCLFLAEAGIDMHNTDNAELVVAKENFYFIGTMNPGGDFGKKELSPALRNRFTEIWCESCTDPDDLVLIIEHNIKPGICFGNQQDGTSGIGKNIMEFVQWFRTTDIGTRFTISIRDILTWVNFINKCADAMELGEAYYHGACLTFLDSLGSGVTSTESPQTLSNFYGKCIDFLKVQTKNLPSYSVNTNYVLESFENKVAVGPFSITKGPQDIVKNLFWFNIPITIDNTLRLLRGMQLEKAILLEGSPGVGKTSLVTALARISGHKIFRVNLSDQTDISDLFGADLPSENGTGGQFSWRDGPLLQALKAGSWVLLDELNLASQSVLEGLNACLDHRGEIFIPELGKTFHVQPGTRFFACQNPLKQGGCRRGLPQSFLNRFIQVYVTTMATNDLQLILKNQFELLPEDITAKMVEFNTQLEQQLNAHKFGFVGSPWECNLRDLTRWCEVTLYDNIERSLDFQPESFVELIYGNRMRTLDDKLKINAIFKEVFNRDITGNRLVAMHTIEGLFIGDACLGVNCDEFNSNVFKQEDNWLVLRTQLPILRSLAYCVNLNWMSILVGSSGSGKTSVVKTLANLAGKTLKTLSVTSAMDTTDILGGFEQIDYTRHLDEIIKETDRVVRIKLQRLLAAGNMDMVLSLLTKWETFLEEYDTIADFTAAAAKPKILTLLDELEAIRVKAQVNLPLRLSYQNKCKVMREVLEKEGSLNAGGKFEWVDSVLIKCLQDGDWLLVDNVNLCSAAVLDRLNALVEPNGVLTIAERGVDEQKQMIEIKPHTNFRLFLTMDPKNGEISRAMRNRGLEIYMLNNDEAGTCNEYDLKSLISHQGINLPQVINVLMSMHKFICGQILFYKPSTNELIRTASIVAQELQQQGDTCELITEAILDVYFKSRITAEYDSEKVYPTIRDEVHRLLSTLPNADDFYHKDNTLKTLELQNHSRMEMTRQHTSVFKNVAYPKTVSSLPDWSDFLVVNYYTTSSPNTVYLRHHIAEYTMPQPTLASDIEDIISDYCDKKICPEIQLPIDFRWIPDTNYGGHNHEINMLYVSLYLQTFSSHQNVYVDNMKRCARGRDETTLLEYAEEVSKNRIEDTLGNTLVKNFIRLISEYDSYLKIVKQNIRNLSAKTTVELLYLVSWRFIFYSSVLVNVKNQTREERHLTLTRFRVFYNWFVKYAVHGMSKLSGVSIQSDLKALLKKNYSVDTSLPPMYRVGRLFQKTNNRPEAYPNLDELTANKELRSACDFYNMCSVKSQKLSLISPETRTKLVDMQIEGNITEHVEFLTKISNDFLTGDEATSSAFAKELYPLADAYNHLLMREIMLNVPNATESVSLLYTSVIIPPDLAATILRYNQSKDESLLHKMRSSFYLYLMNSPSVNSRVFLGGEADKSTLSPLNPLVSFHLTRLLVQNKDKGPSCTLGHFREFQQQNRFIRDLIWSNGVQMSEKYYDVFLLEVAQAKESYKKFLRTLSTALHVERTDTDTDGNIVEKCVQEVIRHTNDNVGLGLKHKSRKFNECLKKCVLTIEELMIGRNFDKLLENVSNVYIRLGFMKSYLNSMLPLIDPEVKSLMKHSNYQSILQMFKDMRITFDMYNDLCTAGHKNTLHPYHEIMSTKIEELSKKLEKFKYKHTSAARTLSYETVTASVANAISTLLSKGISNLSNISLDISNVNAARPGIPLPKLSIYDHHMKSLTDLIDTWIKISDDYPEILYPLLADASEYFYGLKLKICQFRRALIEQKYACSSQKLLLNLLEMPYSHNGMQQLQLYTNETVIKQLKSIIKDPSFETKLLMCGIEDYYNLCVFASKAHKEMDSQRFLVFCALVEKFIKAWNAQEEDKEKRKEEASGLYKTKTKCNDLPEEQQIENEIKELFPNYHLNDFSDLQSSKYAYDAPMDEDPAETSSKPEPSNDIPYESLKSVAEMHMLLVQHFTKSEWHTISNRIPQCDLVQPLVGKYEFFRTLMDSLVISLDYSMDVKLIGSFGIMAAVVSHHGDTKSLVEETGSPVRIIKKASQDFYKDSNIERVTSACHILENLRTYVVSELLDKWPDQPSLKTIVTVIDRIQSFDVTSPLPRFLTGFELLLSKCYEWEEIAHSGISIKDHTYMITQQVILWRKMELNLWKDILSRTYERMNQPLAKWWVYLYNSVHQWNEETSNADELLTILQAFITKSNLAEFESRLNLLYAFHCYATNLPGDLKTFVNISWNVYNYFQQFSAIIANKIKDLRGPIEKKLKDYVKIVRWKDINYWTIKETVEKTHKTLHKFVKEYQEILEQSVAPHLSISTNNPQVENVGIWDRPKRQIPKTYHYTLDVDTFLVKISPTRKAHLDLLKSENPVAKKTLSYFIKSRKLVKTIISTTKYPSLVKNLDGFLTDVIETSTHLQKLEVNTSLPKEKRISQGKNILQQKHRALADLFKTLSKIGLSYRSGIVQSQNGVPNSHFMMMPIDLNANYNNTKSGKIDEKILTMWESSETYNNKSLVLLNVLDKVLRSPAKDLGMQNVERCKGFAYHLWELEVNHKQSLIKASRALHLLRVYSKQMHEFCDNTDFIKAIVLENLTEILNNTTFIIAQLKTILNSCPKEEFLVDDTFKHIAPPQLLTVRKTFKYKNDEVWTKAMNMMVEANSTAEKILANLQKYRGRATSTDYDFVAEDYVPIPAKPQLKHAVHNLVMQLSDLLKVLEFGNLSDSIRNLLKQFLAIDLGSNQEEDTEDNLDDFTARVVRFKRKMLIVMQNVYKKYSSNDTEAIKEADEEARELESEHFQKLLLNNLSEDIEILKLRSLSKMASKIAETFFKINPNKLEPYKAVLEPVLPFFEQTIGMFQYFFTQQVCAYRVTCKMSTILYNIFIELVTKGFCIPPEVSDEMDSEGVSKSSDGLGLGEGEGERDVSDKIESEDQLDDAQPAGQEKQQEKDPDCKEEDNGIEMSEDFDSKLQDKKQKDPDDDDSDSGSDSDEDADDQMGETGENADQLDKEIWGSDEEEDVASGDEGNEQKDEKGDKGEKDGDDELGANEDKPSKSNEKNDETSKEEKEKNKPEINEMDEPEFDDEQTDPYHGNQPELPEPEPMDLPDDLQLDDGQENDNEAPEENPFDIDSMKDENPPEEKPEDQDGETKDDSKKDDDNVYSSDDEEITKKQDKEPSGEPGEEQDDSDKKEQTENEMEKDTEEESAIETEENIPDQTQSNEENVEAMDVEDAQASDKAQASQMENQKSNQPIDDLCQEDRPDQEGVGQSQMEESSTGHTAQTSSQQELKGQKREMEEDTKKAQKPGESDMQRSLGDVNQPVKKKLKTLEAQDSKDTGEEQTKEDMDAEMYQHIKEAKEKTTQVLDAATNEQAESQVKEKPNHEDEEAEEPTESSENLPVDEEEMDVSEVTPNEKPEKTESIEQKKSNKKQHPEGDILEDLGEIDIEGEVVKTSTVSRAPETTSHTNYTDTPKATVAKLSSEEIQVLRGEVVNQLSSLAEQSSDSNAEQTWHKISSITSSLARDLSEQLRLVLEPTQASRLKGDFRTGKRINMRKVIPYIASEFRKDKIWLRRTKPSKREYQIVLAIDDSSSMKDNQAKELTFESVSLLSKALTLLESGELAVLSFGEKVEVLHKLTEQFTDKTGAKLLEKLQFDQKNTCIGRLVNFTTEMFNQSQTTSSALIAKLLVIVSDGRGVFSDGKSYVQQAVRRAQLEGIFMVFVIVDNPESRSSIFNIREPVFKGNEVLRIDDYMDSFPFPFYIVLRDINTLPSCLSDALRQWFEIVTNLDK